MATIHGSFNHDKTYFWGGGGLNGREEDDFIYGHEGNDDLFGAEGSDYLDGGSGIDVMEGGDGNDTYIVDNVRDLTFEYGDQGYDTVQSYVSYSLSQNFESLQLLNSAEAIQGVGNDLDNSLSGNRFNNLLFGMDGHDTLFGFGGHDQIWGGRGNDEIYGGDGNDRLYGENQDDQLYGDAGNDILDGGVGRDIMYGGRNDDTYYVDDIADQVVEYSDEGRDTVFSTIASYTMTYNVEDLVLDGSASDGIGNGSDNQMVGNTRGNYLSGNGGNDILYGMEGDDTLDGGMGGTDHLYGGIGNDTFMISDRLDVVHEDANEGIDTVISTSDYVLGANVENLTLLGGSYGAGNALANTLTGNGSANYLNGSFGADTMIGLRGDDVYEVDNVGDIVTEAANAGSDTVFTSVSYTLSVNVETLRTASPVGTTSINLTGNSIANSIYGNNGNNLIDGGAGNDTLFGGGGQDYFMFDTAIRLSPNIDTILDFNIADDTIYLENSVFSTLATVGNLARGLTASEFFVGTAAHDADDRIIYNSQTGALSYDADGSGATSAVQFATLGPGLALTMADFLIL